MQGQTGTTILDNQRQHSLRKNMADAERCLWNVLRNRQTGCKFRRQHPFENYILDFVCLEQRPVIEVDGGQHASNTEYDKKRTEFLQRAGFQVLRLWNNEVLTHLDSVKEHIWQFLESRQLQTHPPPSLPLERGGTISSNPVLMPLEGEGIDSISS
jgi:very-short-patch-repair endonuclease